MELTIDNTVEYTEYLIREYYKLNLEPMFSVLDQDVMWIGPGNLFVFGAAAVKSCFKDGFVMPPMVLENLEFHSLEAGPTTRIAAGRYYGHSTLETQQLIAGYQRITMHYAQSEKDGRVWLTHMHISNEWNELVDDEVFPVRVSSQTYYYVQRILQERSGARLRHKVVLNSRTAIQCINPDLVVYLEAVKKDTVLHMIDKCITVNRMLGELIGLFPKNFYRVHRGYTVNCEYIDKIENRKITMATGAVLFIPEKRYAQVRKEIAQLMAEECQYGISR